MAKSIKSNYIFNLLLNISSVVFPLITAPYVSRVLSPEGIGVFNFTNTYASYFSLFAGLGIATYGIREIAKRKDSIEDCSKFISQIISLELITTALASLAYVISIFCVGQLNENAILFLIAGISLYLTPLRIDFFFSGREEFGFITLRTLIIRVISIILLFLLVKERGDLIIYILLNALGIVGAYAWNFIRMFKDGIRIKICTEGIVQHLKPIIVLFASSVSISIYVMLDTLILGFISDYTEVGYYNTAMHLVRLFVPVAASLSSVAMPRVSNYMSKNQISEINALMNKSIGLVSLLAFPLTIGVVMVSPTFVPLFFGEDFGGSILPMQIGAFVIIAIGLNNLNGVQVLIGTGHDKLFLYSVTTGAVFNLIINLILIPHFGATGAALSSVLAETLIFCINEYFMRKYTEIRVTNYRDVLKAFIGASSFVPICIFLLSFLSGWVFVIFSAVICALLYGIIEVLLKNYLLGLYADTILKKLHLKS